MAKVRRYPYVGPADLHRVAAAVDAFQTPAMWLAARDLKELNEPFTFIVSVNGLLWLAARRNEHVDLAGGQDVLAAGEIMFASTESTWRVLEVTNQSTGYCPDPDSWPAVAAALDHFGIRHPGGFTDMVIFRRCPACGERNIVRDEDFACALCDSTLPAQWNFLPG